MDRIKNEPVFIVVIAAGILLLGIDLAALSETVERVLSLVVLLGGAKVAREQVVPERKL